MNGHVDRHGQRRTAGAPGGHLLGHLVQQPVGEHANAPGLFGKRNKRRRRHPAALGVQPAQQRLGLHQLAVRNAHLRLVKHMQFVLLNGPTQLAQQRQLLAPTDHPLGAVFAPRLVRLLGGVQRHLGMAQQHARELAVQRKTHNAQRHRQVNALVVQGKGLTFERLRDVLVQGVVVQRLHARDQQSKHIAAEPVDPAFVRSAQAVDLAVVGPQGRQPGRGHLQHRVASGKAQQVVDGTQAVQMHQHQHAAVLAGQRGAERLVQRQAVTQAGEFVAVNQLQHRLFALGNGFAHGVEPSGQLGHLVLLVVLDAGAVVALGNALGDPQQVQHRAGEIARHPPRQQQRQAKNAQANQQRGVQRVLAARLQVGQIDVGTNHIAHTVLAHAGHKQRAKLTKLVGVFGHMRLAVAKGLQQLRRRLEVGLQKLAVAVGADFRVGGGIGQIAHWALAVFLHKGVHIAQAGLLAVVVERAGVFLVLGGRRGLQRLLQVACGQHARHRVGTGAQAGVGGFVDAVRFELVNKQGVGRRGHDVDGGEHQQDFGLHAPRFAEFHLPLP